jgi:hypothetical protein
MIYIIFFTIKDITVLNWEDITLNNEIKEQAVRPAVPADHRYPLRPQADQDQMAHLKD